MDDTYGKQHGGAPVSVPYYLHGVQHVDALGQHLGLAHAPHHACSTHHHGSTRVVHESQPIGMSHMQSDR